MLKNEPYKIKSVRNLNFMRTSERRNNLRNVFFNINHITNSNINFDMISQGSSAMSQEQVSSLFLGDEAYAGARNFNALVRQVHETFGLKYICPIHNRYGGLKLLSSIMVTKDSVIGGNTDLPRPVVEYYGGNYEIFDDEITDFINRNKGNISFIYLDLQGGGYAPFPYKKLKLLKRTADDLGIKVILDLSCIVEYVYQLKNKQDSLKDKSCSELIKKISELGHSVLFDAGQDSMSNTGGFLATNNIDEHEKYRNEVVVYEGLHTYGGMAGRTMEVIAVGLKEMTDGKLMDWIHHQVSLFSNWLEKAGVPLIKGCNGVFLKTSQILPQAEKIAASSFAAALYLTSGVRAVLEGPFVEEALLPILIPRRALMNTQLKEIAEAIINVFQQKENIPPLTLLNKPDFFSEAQYRWVVPNLEVYDFTCEPYLIHSIEHVGMKSRKERKKAVIEAGYNTFLLKSEDVTIDFLTDSGTSAMSVNQWMSYLKACESTAASDSYYDILDSTKKIYGYKFLILTHQGRSAEHIMSQIFIRKGDYVPGNMYFTTTKLHQEMAGGIFVDIIVDEAHKTDSDFLWKGNIDLKKLEALYFKSQREGKKIAYVSYEFNVNMAGGQPVSMDNIKEVYSFCKPKEIPVFFDATRCAENACFIQRRDQNYADFAVSDILLEMFSYGDGATISSKKDMLSNLSGCLIFKDRQDWYEKALKMLPLFEGSFFSGGTSAGDMAAHAQGLLEMVEDRYINSRISQTAYLGKLLRNAGIPIVLPPGGHAIFLDAKRFLPHIDQDQFPAQMLASQIFIETGVRAMERGNVSKGRDPETGKNYHPKLELVRLTIPRRVYTQDHIKNVAEGIINLYKKRETIKGLRFTYEPKKLRFFQGRFEEVK